MSNKISGKNNRLNIWGYISVLIMVGMAVNLNTLSNGFVWDDMHQVVNNRWITDTRYLKEIFSTDVASIVSNSSTSYYRPLMYVIYMIVYQFFGLAAWSWHLSNVLLHTGVVIALFFLLKQLIVQTEIQSEDSANVMSFVAALLFAVHPIHSEAVAWVAAVPELSYSLFYLLSFWVYLKSHGEQGISHGKYIMSLVLYFLAMLCKEPAITLPILILGWDYSGSKSIRDLRFRKYLPFLGVACLYLFIRHHVLGGFAPSRRFPDLSTVDIALNAPVLLGMYLGKLALPIDLTALYAYVPVTLFNPGVAAGILMSIMYGFAMWMMRRNRLIFTSMLLLIVPVLPALYIPALSVSLLAERYVYLSSAGFVILLSLVFKWLKNKTSVTVAAALLLGVIGCYSTGTVLRNGVWKDSFTLWGDTVKKTPNSAYAHLYHGYALYQANQLVYAESEYLKAISIDPTLVEAYINLGILHHRAGKLDKAIETYMQAIAVAPASAMVHKCLGAAYEAKGDLGGAIHFLSKGLQMNPNDSDLHNSLGKAYANAGQLTSASSEFKIAATLDPANSEYAANLEKVLRLQHLN